MLNKYLFLSELHANRGFFFFFASDPQLRPIGRKVHNRAN